MKIYKSAVVVLGAGFLLMARLVTIPNFEIKLLPSTPTPDNHIFAADQPVIQAGGCVTLSWDIPRALRVVLDGSNWPDGVQEAVTAAGQTVVCPSAATHYVPGEPVHYTLKVAYVDGHDESYETVIRYDGASDTQIQPTATLDPYATPAGIPSTPDGMVNAAFQPFENGWMIWRGDTNVIFVLFSDGSLKSYHADEIPPALMSNILPTVPPGRVQPSFPFELLWRGFPDVAAQIGWPIVPAQSYSATVFGQVSFGFGITLPDGRYVGLNIYGAWYMSGSTGGTWTVSGATVTFMQSSYPTLTPVPSATSTRLNGIYQTFEHGFMLWRQDQNCVYTYIYTADNAEGGILIPHDIRVINDVSSAYHYCVEVALLPDNPISDPAPWGLLNPTGALGQVWGHYADVRKFLGYATAPELNYVASIPPRSPSSYSDGGGWSDPVITLPDGRVLSCGFRSASSGMCSLS
ncbi:MAG: hypothetical protein ABI690_21585 [Chloroflexota bacterium]